MKQEKRFVRVHTESSGFEVSSIWVDRKTGVSYFGTPAAMPAG